MKTTLRVVVIAAAALVASCSSQEGYEPGEGAEELGSDTSAAPDVSPTAAPGVAFTYDYDFRLPDERIDDVQEAHASQCERLGIDRCRITGIRYSVDAQEQVYGMLRVKLDPAIARQFGKNAAAGVEQAGGQLINAEFTGTDEGSVIRRTASQREEVERQIAEIERRLASAGPNDRERTELQQQLAQLRSQLAQARTSIAQSEERLALTPMTLSYYGKGGVPGFGGRNPVEDAWRTFIGSSVTMIQFLLLSLAVLLPWGALLLLIVLLLRSRPARAVRKWWSSESYKRQEQPAED
jgi:hypothetical protein